MILHIYASPTLLNDIRLEIVPYIAANQPPNIFGIPEPPRLCLKDVDGLVNACPLLKAAFYECLRLYSRALFVRKVTTPVSVADSNIDGTAGHQTFAVDSGAYLVAPLSSQTQEYASSCETSEVFRPQKFLKVGQDGQLSCAEDSISPWGFGTAACPGRYVAEKQVLTSVAAIVSLWDIDFPCTGESKIPKSTVHSMIAVPSSDVRVLIQARELSMGKPF